MGEFKFLPLGKICVSPWNLRRSDPTSASIHELAESLQAVGLLEPILVRPLPAIKRDAAAKLKGVEFELVAGERRWSAAGVAGFAEIGCLVRDMTDEEVQLALITENLQREQLDPFAEAEGLRMLQGLRPDWSYEQIGKELGRSPKWVATRRRLGELHVSWRAAVEQFPECFVGWGVAHFEEVAKLSTGSQIEFLNSLGNSDEGFDDWRISVTVDDLRSDIKAFMHELSSAPWSLDLVDLVDGIPSCNACDKRSGLQPLLFEVEKKKTDRCLDARCWDRKQAAFVEKRKVELAAKHENLVVAEKPNYSMHDCKKSDPKAVPVLVAHGREAGKLVYQKPYRDEPFGGGLKHGAKPTGPKTLAQKRLELEARRRALALEKFREAILANEDGLEDRRDLLRLAAMFGLEEERLWDFGHLKVLAAYSKVAGEVEMYYAIWRRLAPRLDEWLTLHLPPTTNVEKVRAEWKKAEWLAGILEIRLDDFWVAAVEQIPEPKSWAKDAPPTVKGNARSRPAKVEGKAAAAGER